jgi:hypothetical protein
MAPARKYLLLLELSIADCEKEVVPRLRVEAMRRTHGILTVPNPSCAVRRRGHLDARLLVIAEA